MNVYHFLPQMSMKAGLFLLSPLCCSLDPERPHEGWKCPQWEAPVQHMLHSGFSPQHHKSERWRQRQKDRPTDRAQEKEKGDKKEDGPLNVPPRPIEGFVPTHGTVERSCGT